MAQTRTLLYAILKPLVKLGARLFFRRIEVRGLQNLPNDRPVILVANHQNAMLDPVLLCLMLPRQLHWLTRADVFRHPTANKLLRRLNMLPVYRERDRVDDLHAINKLTFDECHDRLREHAILCVFPEGTHRGKKQLIALKKGVARMAMNAYINGLKDVCIVPVGLDYDDYYNYRASLYINIGEPLYMKTIDQRFPDHVKAQNQLLSSIASSLRHIMIHIERNDVYEVLMSTEPLCHKLATRESPAAGFEVFHQLVDAVNTNDNLHDEALAIASPYHQLSHKLGLDERLYLETGPSVLQYFAWIMATPLALAASIFFYPLYHFTEAFIRRTVKDPLFKNSIRLCAWTFLVPLQLILAWVVVAIASSVNLAWIVILCVVLCGLVALPWWQLKHKIDHHRKVRRYQIHHSADLISWKQYRQKLADWIVSIKTQ